MADNPKIKGYTKNNQNICSKEGLFLKDKKSYHVVTLIFLAMPLAAIAKTKTT